MVIVQETFRDEKLFSKLQLHQIYIDFITKSKSFFFFFLSSIFNEQSPSCSNMCLWALKRDCDQILCVESVDVKSLPQPDSHDKWFLLWLKPPYSFMCLKILLKDANTPVFSFYLLFYILSCQVHWVCVKWKRLYTIAYAQVQRHTTVRNISEDPWHYLWYFRVFHWHSTSLRQSWHCSYDITIKAEAANRF